MQTRDEYFAGQSGKNIKPSHPNKNDLYRTGVIIRVNGADEYAVVPLTTKRKIPLKDYYDKKTYAKDMIEIFDCDGKPIKQGGRFVVNSDSRKVCLIAICGRLRTIVLNNQNVNNIIKSSCGVLTIGIKSKKMTR